MLSRKEQETEGKSLPQFWLDALKEELDSIYLTDRKKENKEFFIWGEIYQDEFVLVASYVSKKNLGAIPVTYNISVDLGSNSDIEKIYHSVVDSISVFFDSYFHDHTSESWDGFHSEWIEAQVKTIPFFYRVTRENIELTIEANKLLI